MNNDEVVQREIFLPLSMVEQEGSLLCWAAVAVALNKYYLPSSTLTQKELAVSVFGGESYNHVYPPDAALSLVHHLKSSCNRPLTPDEIRAELMLGNPVAACMRYFIGWHLTLVYGITAANELYIADSLHGYSVVPFKQFVEAYKENYTWTHSYTTHKEPA